MVKVGQTQARLRGQQRSPAGHGNAPLDGTAAVRPPRVLPGAFGSQTGNTGLDRRRLPALDGTTYRRRISRRR